MMYNPFEHELKKKTKKRWSENGDSAIIWTRTCCCTSEIESKPNCLQLACLQVADTCIIYFVITMIDLL